MIEEKIVWHKLSEELPPNKDDTLLVQFDDFEIEVCRYEETEGFEGQGRNFWHNDGLDDLDEYIIAWAKLPKGLQETKTCHQ